MGAHSTPFRFHRSVLNAALGVALASALAGTAAAQGSGNADWPSYNRTFTSQRYVPLDEINTKNVAQLKAICTYDLGVQTEFETGPLVIGDTLYGTSEMDIFAIDANTCQEKWRTHEDIQIRAPHFMVNRGAAYLDGKLFRGTQDGRVFGYDAATGKRLWEQKIINLRGETVPAAPIAWNGLVFIGNAGGDLKGGKGRIYALDANTGKIVWETYLVPAAADAPDVAAAQATSKVTVPTWKNNADAMPISGGATWTSYTLDAAKGLLYVPGGNPAPDYAKGVRPGANLLAGSVVVLDAKTGALKRFFSLVPQDFHDWDVSAAPALITTKKGVHLLADAGKNGLLYGIDLDSGKRLYQTAITTRSHTAAPLTKQGTHFCPGSGGGTEWNGPAYDPQTNLIFDGTVDRCTLVKLADDAKVDRVAVGRPWTGDDDDANPFGLGDDHWAGWLNATDADTGKIKWRFKAPGPVLSGITPTQGGIVFAGDMNGNVYAFDAASGKVLWQTKFDGAPGGGLISYAVGGHQRVAVISGTITQVFALEAPKGNAKITIFGF
jgi:alcohol dehydrogenase (cytochrome c)